jgi:hypothetical protein
MNRRDQTAGAAPRLAIALAEAKLAIALAEDNELAIALAEDNELAIALAEDNELAIALAEDNELAIALAEDNEGVTSFRSPPPKNHQAAALLDGSLHVRTTSASTGGSAAATGNRSPG